MAKALMTSLIDILISRENLTAAQVTAATEAIACGSVDQTQISAFLVLLRSKGETTEEVAALVSVMRKHMCQVDCSAGGPVLDIVGNVAITNDFTAKAATSLFKVDTTDGRVGIKNLNPSTGLDVGGDSRISGGLTAHGGFFTLNPDTNFVGINTDNPLAALDIRGSIQMGGHGDMGVTGYTEFRQAGNISENKDFMKLVDYSPNSSDTSMLFQQGAHITAGEYQVGDAARMTFTSPNDWNETSSSQNITRRILWYQYH